MVKEAQRKRILTLLKQKPYVTNKDLNRICYRYSARIYELRHYYSYIIECRREYEGIWRYWLVREKEFGDEG